MCEKTSYVNNFNAFVENLIDGFAVVMVIDEKNSRITWIEIDPRGSIGCWCVENHPAAALGQAVPITTQTEPVGTKPIHLCNILKRQIQALQGKGHEVKIAHLEGTQYKTK